MFLVSARLICLTFLKFDLLDAGTSSEETKAESGQDPMAKPNLSYAELIKLAVNSSPNQRMTLNEIYGWIMQRYPYYRIQEQEGNQSWKVSSSCLNFSKQICCYKMFSETGDLSKRQTSETAFFKDADFLIFFILLDIPVIWPMMALEIVNKTMIAEFDPSQLESKPAFRAGES